MKKSLLSLNLIAIALFSWGCPPNPNTGPGFQRPSFNDTGGVGDVGGGFDVGDDVFETGPNPDAGADITYPEVDVWAGEPSNTIETATPFDAGQSLGGVIGPSEGQSFDTDVFAVELQAGTVFSFTFGEIGEGLMLDGVPMVVAALRDRSANIYRGLDTAVTQGREVFIPTTGTYYLVVVDVRAGEDDHGGPTSYYTLETSTRALAGDTPTIPGLVSESLADGNVRAYRVSGTEDGVLLAETTAGRAPVSSDVDTVLYGWDVERGRLAGYNDDIEDEEVVEDTFDSLMLMRIREVASYWVVVDMYTTTARADFTLYFEVMDNHPLFPRALTTGGSVAGAISAAVDGEADTDYFYVDVAPGQTMRLLVEAEGTMQPAIEVYDGMGFFVGAAAPVEGRAAITFTHSAGEAQGDSYYIIVNDRRNVALIEGEATQTVGGAGFGYTISASLAALTPQQVSLPLTQEATLGEVGQINWYRLEVPARNIVELDVRSQNGSFQPVVGQLLSDDFDMFLEAPTSFVQGAAAGSVTLGVRDLYYRGGMDYLYTPRFRLFDPRNITFAQVNSADAANTAGAQELSLPIAVSGTLTGPNIANLGAHHFKVNLTAGQTLVLRTEGDQRTDTQVSLLNQAGATLARNDFHLGQRGTHFSAIVFDVTQSADYFIVVEPYCTSDARDGCQGNGEYRLELFDGAQ